MTHMHIYLLLVCLLLSCHKEPAFAGQDVERPPCTQPSGIEDMLRGVKHEIAKLVDEAKQDATGAKWSKPSIVIAILTGLIALAALYKTWITARNQSTDEKKRLVLLILERIDKLAAINWDGPDPSDVRKAINALGLISICWRNNMVDRKLTALMFGELFQRYVREFDTHRDVQIKQYNKTVAELLGAELCGLQQVAEEIRKIH